MDWLDQSALRSGLDLAWLASRLADGVRGGRHRSTRRGRGIEFAQHRSYDRGDDVRLIDWRAYARTDRLVVREAESDADHRFWILIDTSASMAAATEPGASASKLQTARVLAATLAAMAERQGDDYGLALLGTDATIALPPGQGRNWYSRLLAQLDGLVAAGRLQRAPLELLSLIAADARSTDIVILGDGYQHDDEWERAVRELASARRAVRYICLETRLEQEFALAGTRRLVDLETGATVIADPAAAAAYRRAREDHLRRLQRALTNIGGRFERFAVDQPWDRQVRTLFASR